MPYIPLDQRPPAEQRAFYLHYARVMLREARARRGSKGNEWMLLGAQRARRQAAAIDVGPRQGVMLLGEAGLLPLVRMSEGE